MSCIPCKANNETIRQIDEIAEILKTQAHQIQQLGLTERELYETGLFRGAVEKIRGEFAASLHEKRTFAKVVLNYLEDAGLITSWALTDGHQRYTYDVETASGRRVAIAMKGCLDGNNITLYERPPHADEFYIWSVCRNAGASPPRNAWSGITRLGAQMLTPDRRVDGVIIWDMVCGTIGRPCPKILAGAPTTDVGPFRLPPPCVYALPARILRIDEEGTAEAQPWSELTFFAALAAGFQTDHLSRHDVSFDVSRDGDIARTRTRVRRDGAEVKASPWKALSAG